jgi:hypothetical protein
MNTTNEHVPWSLVHNENKTTPNIYQIISMCDRKECFFCVYLWFHSQHFVNLYNYFVGKRTRRSIQKGKGTLIIKPDNGNHSDDDQIHKGDLKRFWSYCLGTFGFLCSLRLIYYLVFQHVDFVSALDDSYTRNA